MLLNKDLNMLVIAKDMLTFYRNGTVLFLSSEIIHDLKMMK
jgi:hypothetical protein